MCQFAFTTTLLLLLHKGYIRRRKINEPIGDFNQRGHSITDLKVSMLDKVIKDDNFYRKEREIYLIRKFNTFYGGLNKSPFMFYKTAHVLGCLLSQHMSPAMHTSTSKHRKSIRKPGVLRAEMMEESESGQKPGESGVRKGNPG